MTISPWAKVQQDADMAVANPPQPLGPEPSSVWAPTMPESSQPPALAGSGAIQRPVSLYQPTPEEQQIAHDTQRLQKVQWEQANPWGSPENHPGRLGKVAHVFSTLGNIAGDIFAPSVMSMIPGTELHRSLQEQGLAKRLNSEIGDESTNEQRNALTKKTEQDTALEPGKTASEEGLQGATTRHLNDESAGLEQDAANGPSLANSYAHAVNQAIKNGQDPSSDPVVQYLHNAITDLQKQPAAAKESNPQQQTFDDLIKRGMTPEQAYEKIREKPPGESNAGTWSLQYGTDGKPILFNSKTAQTREAPANIARKPNAEEIKRNDLAGNVNENLDKLQDIVTRRPELFGPLSGRMTKLREAVGTSDPDVAALKTIEDNLGMALQSAHGMRSAQHVETSAQSVLNGLKNSPEALKAAIQTARNSVGTFQHDVQNTNEAGHGAAPQGAPAIGTIEDGYRYKGGNPSDQSSWEQVKK